MKTISLLIYIPFLLVFSCCSSTEPDDKEDAEKSFENTLWVLEFFEENGTNVNPPSDQEYNITFSSDTTFSGQCDCNRIGGLYYIEENGKISVTKIGTSFAYCGDDSKDDIYYGGIQNSYLYVLNKNKLVLHYSENSALHFISN